MRRCEVYIHGIKAGILTEIRTPREYIFRYSDDYRRNPKNPPVSLTMPLSRKEYRSPHLFPYFANILSEGENRTVQSFVHKLDRNDDFGILLATATHDTPGAVTVRPID